jgi:hypothetical protein
MKYPLRKGGISIIKIFDPKDFNPLEPSVDVILGVCGQNF